MVTEQHETNKKCCLYASDFHLEMILLPYIKNNIDKTKFIIITQNDLRETIKILLDRVNITNIYKKNILNLNWTKSEILNTDYIKNIINENEKIDIIIKGDKDYIERVNKELELLINSKVSIIDCFCIEDSKIDVNKIKSDYKEFLSTSMIE